MGEGGKLINEKALQRDTNQRTQNSQCKHVATWLAAPGRMCQTRWNYLRGRELCLGGKVHPFLGESKNVHVF